RTRSATALPAGPAAPAEASVRPPATAGDAGSTTSNEAADELDGLPQRVRRRTPAAQPRSTVTDTPSPRSPEEVRRVMAALQAGTARGRATVITPTAPAGPPPPPETPTATERDA
ncbi:ATP-binding protein, partial [Micromonospora sp. STR1s_6]|nr:ATP-binding protein [Micromonospora tarensis]